MAKPLCSVLVSFLLLVCVWAENSKVGRVNLASLAWKDAEDDKNCYALELKTSSLSVMHIQSKCSPFRLPNSTWWRAVSESIKGDTQRYRAMIQRELTAGKNMVNLQEDADLPIAAAATGAYIIKLGFGTPEQSLYTILDTSLSIAWIPCEPCSNCSSGLFEQSKSSTYNYLTCASPQCEILNLSNCTNNNNSNSVNCSLIEHYGDGSTVEELLSTDTLSVGSQPVEDFVFRCAKGATGVITPGLVGFGRHDLSFLSQTATLYSRTFSYCFPSYFSSAFTGSLLLGEGALSAPGLQFTPLLSNARKPYVYYVGLNGISVGEELVSIPEGTFTLDQSTGRGTVIDSGTTITRLVKPAYNAMRDSFRRQLSNLTMADSPTPTFDTCYNIPSGEVEFPAITLHFDDGLDLTLPKENSLYPGNEDGSVLCLAFALPPGGAEDVVSIFGSYQQQNYRVVHDVPGSRLGITPENCDGSMLAE